MRIAAQRSRRVSTGRIFVLALSAVPCSLVAGSASAATNAYDGAGRLASSISGGTTVTYSCDGEGNLSKRCLSSACSDIFTSGRRVVGEAGTALAYWPAGLASSNSTGVTTYALADSLETVRGQVSAAGAIVGRAPWGAYGDIRASSGSQSTIGFAGEYGGGQGGVVWRRARAYTPTDGRFVQRDALEGYSAHPASLNRYTYTENSRTGFTDPSGHSILGRENYQIGEVVDEPGKPKGFYMNFASDRPMLGLPLAINTADAARDVWSFHSNELGEAWTSQSGDKRLPLQDIADTYEYARNRIRLGTGRPITLNVCFGAYCAPVLSDLFRESQGESVEALGYDDEVSVIKRNNTLRHTTLRSSEFRVMNVMELVARRSAMPRAMAGPALRGVLTGAAVASLGMYARDTADGCKTPNEKKVESVGFWLNWMPIAGLALNEFWSGTPVAEHQ